MLSVGLLGFFDKDLGDGNIYWGFFWITLGSFQVNFYGNNLQSFFRFIHLISLDSFYLCIQSFVGFIGGMQ